MGSLISRCSLWIPVAISKENAPGFRNHVTAEEGIGGSLLRNRSKSSAINILRYVLVAALNGSSGLVSFISRKPSSRVAHGSLDLAECAEAF
jgi:hypothetical protein